MLADEEVDVDRTERVTVLAVARRAGVSTATVSRVVNGTARVAEDTRGRIRAAIDELGFVPSADQEHRRRRTGYVALVAERLDAFAVALAQALRAPLTAHDATLLTVEDPDPWHRAHALARDGHVDGVLLLGAQPSRARGPRTKLPVPAVALGCAARIPGIPRVACDHDAGAHALVAHLVDLGHRDLALVRGPRRDEPSDVRAHGHLAAVRALGLVVRSDRVVVADLTETGGHRAALALLAARPRPTAIVCPDDVVAAGVLRALRERGVDVPGEMSVVAIGGLAPALLLHPALTTLAHPVGRIATRGVELLHAGTRPPATLVERLPGTLVRGTSTAPPALATLPPRTLLPRALVEQQRTARPSEEKSA